MLNIFHSIDSLLVIALLGCIVVVDYMTFSHHRSQMSIQYIHAVINVNMKPWLNIPI